MHGGHYLRPGQPETTRPTALIGQIISSHHLFPSESDTLTIFRALGKAVNECMVALW